MSGYIFLLLNGYELTAPGDDVVEMAERLACKFYTKEELEDWLAYWGRPFNTKYLCLKSSHPYMSFMQMINAWWCSLIAALISGGKAAACSLAAAILTR